MTFSPLFKNIVAPPRER